MYRLLFLFFLLPQVCCAQLIFDFGIGPQAGLFRLSASQKDWALDSVRNPHVKLDTLDHFSVKPPNGLKFGFKAMASCTLTSPDEGFFFTAIASLNAQVGTMKTYLPDFTSTTAMHNPPVEWEEQEYPFRVFNYSIPLLVCGNYDFRDAGATVYFGLGVAFNKYRGEETYLEQRVVADQPDGMWCTTYEAQYQFTRSWLFEAQTGVVWQNYRGKQSEVFVSGNIGRGKQGAVQVGYLWRFNFYRGD